MKTIILLFIANLVISQEFMTTIYIENSIGDKDSVHIGYDAQATRGIDSIFGELDISEVRFTESLDARVGYISLGLDCEENHLVDYPELISHLSKVDITPRNCDGWENFIPFTTLFFKDENYPLKITWSSHVFQDECLDGSFISDWIPGGWFDASCGGEMFPQVYLKETGEIIIDSRTSIYVVDSFLDTLSMFHLPLSSQSLLDDVKEEGVDELNLYPNPTSGVINVENMDVRTINIFDYSGQLVAKFVDEIDLSSHPNGIYLIQLISENGNAIIKKVVKYDH